jgi:glycosyltransferase involved in cell wall biosynthesis
VLSPRILLSVPACDSQQGSEALVGSTVVERLSSTYSCDVITLYSGSFSSSGRVFRLRNDFDDINDVSYWPLLRFEWAQQRLVGREFLSQYDVLHRVTPSGWKSSLLIPLATQKAVVGPILLSNPPPSEFDPIFRPPSINCMRRRFTKRRLLNSFARRYFEKKDSHLLDRADLIFCGSRVTLGRLSQGQQDRSVVIPYAGVEHERFVPPKGRQRDKVLRLLFAGRLVPYKGLELLLRAVAVVKKRIPVKLSVVGGGNPENERFFKDISASLGLGDDVEFVGKVARERLIDFYQRSDLFCMPSIETYGLAILEAMACGCVPIVADFNGPGEIVEADCGIKIALTDPESFVTNYAKAIAAIADDPAGRGRYSERCREVAVSRHDWNAVLEPICNAYRRLLHD